MQQSTIYIELEVMIEKNWLQKNVSELDQMLKQLEGKGQVTAEERRSRSDRALCRQAQRSQPIVNQR